MKPAPIERTKEPGTLTSATFEDLVHEMLVRLGEDPNRKAWLRLPNAFTKP